MNKHLKKLLSLLLVAAMLFALSVSAFADGTNVKQYKKYGSIGDSVAVAWGYDDEPDTFPRLVAKAVGAVNEDGSPDESLWYHSCGLRLKDVAAAFEVAEYGFEDPYITSGAGPNLGWLQLKAEEGIFNKIAKESDLITLQLGMNDVLYAPFSQIDLEAVLSGGISVEAVTSILENFLAGVAAGLEDVKEYYPKLLDKIKELKAEVGDEDYTVVLVGIFNTQGHMNISDEIPVPIGDALATFSIAANAIIKQIAEDYGFEYVDITNVPTGLMETGYSISDMATNFDVEANSFACHPSYPDGYAYIARQIINALPVEEAKPDYNIRVDLGGVTNVTSVTLGTTKLPESMYSFDAESHTLTVKNLSPFVNMLTVTSKTGTYSTGTYVYTLKYECDSGYKATLLYQNHDVIKTAATVLKGVVKVTTSAVGALKGLFEK